MDVRVRALLDLESVTGVSTQAPTSPGYNKEEARYRHFKDDANDLLNNSLIATQRRTFLDQYFLAFLPALLTAAAKHEGLDRVSCPTERMWLREVMESRHGLLAHSPMLFPLNRRLFAGVPPATPSLDVGIGSGQNSRFSLQGQSLEVGGDIIVSNLLKAREIGPHRRHVAFDMGSLPFADGSFERVFALNSIYHAHAGRGGAATEMARVLAPGGVLALTDVSPFLNDFKPLATFFSGLGFPTLRSDFDRYFLSGYGADSSAGTEEWYQNELPRLGFDDVHVEYLLSPRLSEIAYLFYDWQALFNFDAHTNLVEHAEKHPHWKSYMEMLATVVAPLISEDQATCQRGRKGGYLFVTARKRAGSRSARFDGSYACPQCRVQLTESLECSSCRRIYPIVKGIPLLTTFYADSVRM